MNTFNEMMYKPAGVNTRYTSYKQLFDDKEELIDMGVDPKEIKRMLRDFAREDEDMAKSMVKGRAEAAPKWAGTAGTGKSTSNADNIIGAGASRALDKFRADIAEKIEDNLYAMTVTSALNGKLKQPVESVQVEIARDPKKGESVHTRPFKVTVKLGVSIENLDNCVTKIVQSIKNGIVDYNDKFGNPEDGSGVEAIVSNRSLSTTTGKLVIIRGKLVDSKLA